MSEEKLEKKEDRDEELVLKVQYGLFFDSPLPKPGVLAQDIKDKFSDEFDADRISLPIPENLLDFPADQLKSSDGQWQLMLSKKRVDAVWHNKEELTGEAEIQKKREYLEEVIRHIFDRINDSSSDHDVDLFRVTTIAHIALVVEDPNNYIQTKFFKDTASGRTEVQIRYNEKKELSDDLEVNDIYQYTAGKIRISGQEKEALIVLRDYNTVPERGSALNNSQLHSFLESSKSTLLSSNI